MGHALLVVQQGENPNNAKILTGFGSANIREIKDNDVSGTYRTIYTLEKDEFVFVLHAFQKKGIATDQKDKDTIKKRLKEVNALYKQLKEGGV